MLDIRNLNFSYNGTNVACLENINLTVASGECVVLAGESGCGKSTLLRCINTLAPRFFKGAFSGSVSFQKNDLHSLPFHELADRMCTIFQDPRSQFFSSDPLSELAFVCENLGIERNRIRSNVEESVAATGIGQLLHKTVLQMSGGERQLLAIASVRSSNPKLYLMDEPSASLDVGSTSRIAGVIRTLKQEGATILVSEHKLWYLRDVLDRLIILKNGTIVSEHSREDLTTWPEHRFDSCGLRRLYPELGVIIDRPLSNEASSAEDTPFLLIENLIKKRNGSSILSIDKMGINRGECTVIVGPNGAGKSTLGRIVCGLEHSSKGEVRLNGRKAGRSLLSHCSYYFSQDCDYQLFADSVAEEILLNHKPLPEVLSRAERLIESLGLAPFRDRHPISLSRGQKQRVCAACALMKQPDLIFLDEPTSGLDAGTMKSVGRLFKHTATKMNIAVVAITHDYEFAIRFADRVLVMSKGKISVDFPLDSNGKKRLAKWFFSNTPH